jgi:alanine racemase
MLKIQIDLGVIKNNLLKIKKDLPAATKICAVVKANAYGLGDIKVAAAIENLVDCFGVATVKEGKRLRDANIKKDILVFGVCENIVMADKHNLIITINSLREIQNITRRTRIHIAVDTGMHRFGVDRLTEFQKIIKSAKSNPNISAEGLYTHFAHEADNLQSVGRQLNTFKPYITYFKRHFPSRIIHAAASGTLSYPLAIFDMVRIGKALYGGIEGTQTAVTVRSQIVMVRQLNADERVGYNGTFRAAKPTAIGVISGGYADGIDMRFCGHSFVTVGDTVCQIVGRVCMDCFFIILPDGKNMAGKAVTIISPNAGQTLTDINQKTGVIICDILCGLNHARADVLYYDGGGNHTPSPPVFGVSCGNTDNPSISAAERNQWSMPSPSAPVVAN